MEVRAATRTDAEAIAAIYAPYVRETTITFEEEPVPPAEIEARLEKVARAGLPWQVAERDGRVLGYAYAGPWKERRSYRFTVESSVYVAGDAVGSGVGRALYSRLLDELRASGVRSVIGGIALPNAASVALHERAGFRKVGHFPAVGFKLGRWVDVGYWAADLQSR